MFLATVLFSAVALPQEPQPSTRVMRTVPIGNISIRGTRLHHAPFGSMLNGTNDFVELVHTGPTDGRVDERFVIEFVRNVIDRTGLDAEDELRSATVRSRIALSGPKAVVDRAVETVRILESTVANAIQVDARLFELTDGDSVSTELAAKDVRHWFEPTERTRWNSRSVTRSGHTTVLAQEQYSHYLRDCDIEVAQDQSISDPIVRSLFEGVHLKVEPHALPGSSDLVLFCHVAIGERMGEVEARSTGVTGMAALDVPRLGNNQATFSGRIENGGGLVLTLDGADGTGTRYALAVSARQRAVENQDSTVSVLPISALTSASLSSSVRVDDMRYEEDDHSIFPLRERDTDSMLDTGTVLEMLYHVLEPALDEDEIYIESSGGWVFLIGPTEHRETALRALVTMHDQWVRCASCELVSSLSPLPAGPKGVFGRGDDDFVAMALHRLHFPVIMGRPHFVMRGIESTSLQDVNVEVAQEASGTDPVVMSTFSGLFASLAVEDSTGGIAATASVELSQLNDTERRAAETRHGGDIYLSRTGRTRFLHNGVLESGRPIELGDGGVVEHGGKRYQVRQSLRVDAR